MTAPVWTTEADDCPPEPPPRVLGAVWALLLINGIGYSSVDTVIPFPHSVAQIVTMGSLGVAFMLAIAANRNFIIRPSALLLLLSLLVVTSLAASMQMESGIGAFVRCARFGVFVTTLWLVTPWWRGDFRFAIYHIRTMAAFLVTVLVGMVLSPSAAFSGPDGRLVGAIWPITAPQVGLYCAVATGLTSILWLAGRVGGRAALAIVAPALGLLLLSHTRTALLGLVVALLVAGLSMLSTGRRVRKSLVGTVLVVGVGWLFLWQVVYAFLLRGQDRSQLTSLTGRAEGGGPSWPDPPHARQSSCSASAFTASPTAACRSTAAGCRVYHELGLFGRRHRRRRSCWSCSPRRSLRPPLTRRGLCPVPRPSTCIVSSYTEVGLGDASPYLLHLAVATSLLVASLVPPPWPRVNARSHENPETNRITQFRVPRKLDAGATTEAREAV